MASASALPIKSILFTTALVVTASVSSLNIPARVTSTFTGPGSYSRIFAAIVVILNIKNVPFAWHARIFNSIFQHYILHRPSIPPSLAPSLLFTPLITTSHNPLSETDYNLHKSNSTYFSDLDISRSHLVSFLFQTGLHHLHHNDKYKLVLDKEGKAIRGKWGIMLGGVMCSFKREIGVYEGFEMWSRVLCWDRKWVYIVTHFVRKGTVRPRGYFNNKSSNKSETPTAEFFKEDGRANGNAEKYKDGFLKNDILSPEDEPNVLATSIAKYVFKLGRLTVHPEVIIGASGLLPVRPGGWHSMAGGPGDETPFEGEEVVGEGVTTEEWDWRRTEEWNERGLRFAEKFAGLDGLMGEFTGQEGGAVGRWWG